MTDFSLSFKPTRDTGEIFSAFDVRTFHWSLTEWNSLTYHGHVSAPSRRDVVALSNLALTH